MSPCPRPERFAAALLTASLASCGLIAQGFDSTGEAIKQARLDNAVNSLPRTEGAPANGVEPGRSTRDDVRSLFGPPIVQGNASDDRDYYASRQVGDDGSWVIVRFNGVDYKPSDLCIAVIAYDNGDTARDIVFHEARIDRDGIASTDSFSLGRRTTERASCRD